MTTALRTGAVLVFDGDCAFCTSSVRWLEARFPRAFVAVPYQRTDLEQLGLTERECHDRVQWVGDVGSPVTTREQGARAVSALLRQGGSSRRGLLGLLARGAGAVMDVPPVSWAAAATYSVVARNRQRLPGGTPACRL